MTLGTARLDAPAPPFTRFTALAGTAMLALVLTLAAGAAPATAQSACAGYHTLDTGETLVGIAARCGVTLPALLAANPGVVDDEDVEVGSRLRIPDPGAPQPSSVQACGPFYEVRTGDTVEEIATKCGLTIPLLLAANPPFPSHLSAQTGRKVRIPDVPRAAVVDPATVAAVRQLIADDAAAAAILAADTLPDAEAAAAVELVRVEGVLESGPLCMRVRSANGEATAIAGTLGDNFQPGDRVVLLGVAAADHECGSSPTLDLRILYRAG